ncbi:hypothetical protein K9L05_04090 [Candidatus Babeliales bacterium]|nr:hypothetical protein [Candidatus Babeliales bacterium]MCF7899796.1 hypothetical protein [Candidatus Babeliales bacterium]
MKKRLFIVIFTVLLIATHAFSMEPSEYYSTQADSAQQLSEDKQSELLIITETTTMGRHLYKQIPDLGQDSSITEILPKILKTTRGNKIKMVVKSILQDYVDLKE